MKSQEDNFKKYISLFKAFFKIGLFTFGGGLAMLPIMQQACVDEHKWISEEDMLDCIAVSQSLPGPIAVNAATFVGRKVGGKLGVISAVLGTILPSYIVIILLVSVLEQFREIEAVQGALLGIKASTVGLILFAAYKNWKKVVKSAYSFVIAVLAFVSIIFLNFDAIYVIIAASLIGVISIKLKEVVK